MPAKTYVELQKFSIKTELDPKLRNAAAAAAGQAASDAIAAARSLTDIKPKDKGAKGYLVSGTLVLEAEADTLSVSGNLYVALWPTQEVKATLKASASMKGIAADRLRDRDVKDLVLDLVGDAVAKRAVPFMERTAPE